MPEEMKEEQNPYRPLKNDGSEPEPTERSEEKVGVFLKSLFVLNTIIRNYLLFLWIGWIPLILSSFFLDDTGGFGDKIAKGLSFLTWIIFASPAAPFLVLLAPIDFLFVFFSGETRQIRKILLIFLLYILSLFLFGLMGFQLFD